MLTEIRALHIPGRAAAQRNEDGTDTRILDKAFEGKLSLPGRHRTVNTSVAYVNLVQCHSGKIQGGSPERENDASRHVRKW